jgi:hypothetical protein
MANIDSGKWTLAAIKAENKRAGRFFFEKATMRFFKSRVLSGIYQGPGGVFFVTAETGPSGKTAFTVREFKPENGAIWTRDPFNEMDEYDAKTAAATAARFIPKEVNA